MAFSCLFHKSHIYHEKQATKLQIHKGLFHILFLAGVLSADLLGLRIFWLLSPNIFDIFCRVFSRRSRDKILLDRAFKMGQERGQFQFVRVFVQTWV